ncbi:MAG: hypothetical protein OXH10_09695 [bacterium]|nr:hypothetical protein [bacterium]
MPPDGGEREGSRWSRLRPADPIPVTEEMITPRSGSETPRFCPGCGQSCVTGATRCPACLHEVGSSGSLTDSSYSGTPSDPTPPVGRREVSVFNALSISRVLPVILVIVALVLGVRTLISRDQTVEVVPSSTVATTPTETVQALTFYADRISDIALEVADARTRGRQINDDWDRGRADYEQTLQAMNDLVFQIGLLPVQLNTTDPPASLSDHFHQGLVDSLNEMIASARTMQEGLQSTDTGETRQAGLQDFESATFEFALLSDQVTAAAEELSEPPEPDTADIVPEQ